MSCQPRCGRCPSPPEALGPGRSADRGPSCDEDGDAAADGVDPCTRSEEHTSELQSRGHLVCRLLLEKKKNMWFHMCICMFSRRCVYLTTASDFDQMPFAIVAVL